MRRVPVRQLGIADPSSGFDDSCCKRTFDISHERLPTTLAAPGHSITGRHYLQYSTGTGTERTRMGTWARERLVPYSTDTQKREGWNRWTRWTTIPYRTRCVQTATVLRSLDTHLDITVSMTVLWSCGNLHQSLATKDLLPFFLAFEAGPSGNHYRHREGP
jgi:hypothetical protein